MSWYENMYALTAGGHPLGINEHCYRICESSKTHALCLFDWDPSKAHQVKPHNVVAEPNFHDDLALENRPGGERVALVI